MDYKTKTVALLLVLVLFFVSIGFLINFNGTPLTGQLVAGGVACYEDADCDDSMECTEDLCRNPGTEQSLCINRVKEDCN